MDPRPRRLAAGSVVVLAAVVGLFTNYAADAPEWLEGRAWIAWVVLGVTVLVLFLMEIRPEDPPPAAAHPPADLPPTPLTDRTVDERPDRATPPSPATPRPLPQPAVLFGRSDEIDLVVADLLDGTSPALVLGTGGIGKTAFCETVLVDPRIVARYGDRRYFASLEGTTNAVGVWPVIADALGAPRSSNAEPVVRSHLSAPSLLVLDNCETPWIPDQGATEEAIRQLAGLPELSLVVNLRGRERPGGGPWPCVVSLSPLSDEIATQLFCSIAGTVDPDDPALGPLIADMDGVPLAVVLLAAAAAAEEAVSIADLARRWRAERTGVLRRGAGSDRLASIEASVEVSLVSPRVGQAEQRALALLSQLPGGMQRQQAEELLADTQGIATLLSLALVDQRDGRVRMLTPIREYVAEQVEPDSDIDAGLHAWVDDLAARAALSGREGGEQGADLAAEVPNIEALLATQLLEADPTPAIKNTFAYASAQYFHGLGTFRPLEQAAAAAQRESRGDVERLALEQLGRLAFARSDNAGARDYYTRASRLLEGLGDPIARANALASLGDLNVRESQHATARGQFEEAIQLYDEAGDLVGKAACLRSLGEIDFREGRRAAARDKFTESADIFDGLGHLLGKANSIHCIGRVDGVEEDDDAARLRFTEAAELFERVGDLLGQATCLRTLGEIDARQDDLTTARQRFNDSYALCQRVSNVIGQANCLRWLADVDSREHDNDSARRRLADSALLYEQVGNVLGQANVLRALGEIEVTDARDEVAAEHFRQAAELYAQIDNRLARATVIYKLGQVNMRASETEIARELLTESATEFEAFGEGRMSGQAHRLLARLETDPDRRSEHVTKARDAWQASGEDARVADLDREFPPD